MAEKEGGIPKTYSDIREMLESEKPEGVVCCASIDKIFETSEVIIPFGIPLLVEKPQGTSYNELEKLIKIADEYGTPVMAGLNRRHYSVINKAVEHAGGFDEITAVFIEWSEDPNHFIKRGFSSNQISKMIFGYSLHGLDLLTYLAGDILNPDIKVRNLGDPFRWMMSLHGISDRHALATFQSTWDSPGRWRLSFCARDKRYVFAPLETCVLSENRKTDVMFEPDDQDRQFKPGFYNQAKIFKSVIGNGNVPDQYCLRSVRPAMKLAEILTKALINEY